MHLHCCHITVISHDTFVILGSQEVCTCIAATSLWFLTAILWYPFPGSMYLYYYPINILSNDAFITLGSQYVCISNNVILLSFLMTFWTCRLCVFAFLPSLHHDSFMTLVLQEVGICIATMTPSFLTTSLLSWAQRRCVSALLLFCNHFWQCPYDLDLAASLYLRFWHITIISNHIIVALGL